MNGLRLDEGQLQAMIDDASGAYPEECCGVLVGRSEAGSSRVEEVISAENERQESRHNRYLISPKAILKAQREARERGLDIVGYYHSHPDHPARPSDFDREHAWPGTSYLIVSVEKGTAVDARSWRLADDRGHFDEEPLRGVEEELAKLRDAG